MPPRVAPVQVIVIPIPNSKLTPEESQALLAKAEGIVEQLRNNGVRVKIDKRDIYTPGWKYSHWETKVISPSRENNLNSHKLEIVSLCIFVFTGYWSCSCLSGSTD